MLGASGRPARDFPSAAERERRRAAQLCVEAARTEPSQVAAHCGAQTTADTSQLAAHAADSRQPTRSR